MSTDSVDFRGATGTFFNTGWASATPVSWPGRDFSPPTDGSSWVRFTISEGESFQHEMGKVEVQFRDVGLVMIQVFTELNKGDGPALTLADQVATIFRRKKVTYTDGRAIFRAPNIRRVGPDEAWYQVNVTVPYVRDTLHVA